jgi:hypothetical protein
MDSERPIAEIEALLAAKGEHLRRTATLLAGGPDNGEDLLQEALERMFRRWRAAISDPEGYLRRTMYNLAADGWRRRQSWQAKVPLLSQPTAYLVSHIDSALAAVDDDMMQIHGEVSYASQGKQDNLRVDTWSYRNQAHDLWFFNGVEGNASHSYKTINSRPVWEDTSVSLDYRNRVATKATAISPGPVTTILSCSGHGQGYRAGAPVPGAFGSAATVAASMRALLSCGGLSISWHQHYHGTEAIKIVSHESLRALPAKLEVTQVIWVNEATYLPIAVTTLGGTASQGTAATQYAWLPPTKANLANLTVTIPPGFTVATAKSAPPTGLTLPYAEIAWLFALAGY